MNKIKEFFSNDKNISGKQPTPMKAVDYEKLGRSIEQVYVSGYATKKRLFMMSFYKGIGYGLGIFIGGTIIVALLITILAQFEAVDFLQPIIQPILNTVQDANGGPVVLPPTSN